MSDIDKEVNIYKAELKKWTDALGLPQHQPENAEVEEIIGFSREMLREQSSVHLSEDVVILSQYALFLQQKANECQTFLKWSENAKNRLFDDDRSKMNNWVRQVQLRKERIAYLARRIELMAQSISGLVRARYNEGSNR